MTTLLTEEIISNIIDQIEQGNTLTKICKQKNFPSLSYIYKSMRENEELHKKIMKAREVGVWTLLDQTQDILNEPQDPKQFQQIRELAHHNRWKASKLASGVFGDKIKQEVKADNTLTISRGSPQTAIESEDKKIIEVVD